MSNKIDYFQIYRELCSGEIMKASTHNGGEMDFKLFAANGVVFAVSCGKITLPSFRARGAYELEEECALRDIYKIIHMEATHD